jgi:hypothetical protein
LILLQGAVVILAILLGVRTGGIGLWLWGVVGLAMCWCSASGSRRVIPAVGGSDERSVRPADLDGRESVPPGCYVRNGPRPCPRTGGRGVVTIDQMTFNPILAEGPVPADRGGLWKRTTAAQQLATACAPHSFVVLRRTSVSPQGHDFEVFDPATRPVDSSLDEFGHYYVVDRREHVVAWDVAVAGDDSVLESTVVAVVAVSDPMKVARVRLHDAQAWMLPAVQNLIDACVGDVDAADLADAVSSTTTSLIEHQFDCGLAVRWAHVTIDPSPVLAQHLRRVADLNHEHELAMRRMQFESERLAMQAELARDEQALDVARGEAERIKHDAETEAQRVLDAAKKEAGQIRRQANDEAAQARAVATQQATTIVDNANKEADRIRVGAEETAGRDHLDRLREESRRQLQEAERLNNEIAEHPGKLMGYLLAMPDTTAVREAMKVVEERERAAWERLKELEKLKLVPEEDLRQLVFALLNDPAGGAFGLDVTPREPADAG